MNGSHFWGYHLLLNVAGCNKEDITNPDHLRSWVKALVNDIDMVAYGEPQVVHFGHNEEHLAGWTVIQLIETSNIIAHFCDNTQEGYIDVFSCKPFDIDVAIDNINDWFEPERVHMNYLTRQA